MHHAPDAVALLYIPTYRVAHRSAHHGTTRSAAVAAAAAEQVVTHRPFYDAAAEATLYKYVPSSCVPLM